MFLTVAALPHYLIARGLVSPSSIVDGDFAIVEAARRNRNFKVLRSGGPGLFVKQIRQPELQAVHTLEREAACYRMVQAIPELAPLARLLPGFIDHDPARALLIVDLLPDGENVTEHHMRLGTFPPEIGRLLGRGLAAYHAGLAGHLAGRAEAAVFPRQVHWILTLEATGYATLEPMGGAAAQLAALLRQAPEISQRLAALARQWRADSLIHGDMKWDNCLIHPGPDGEPLLRIVDWELADLGDASWDVGSIVQSYLVYLLLTTPPAPGLPPEVLLERVLQRLGEIRPALRAFWESYAEARGFALAASRSYLERCLRFAAARLIVTIVEHMNGQPQLTQEAFAMLLASLRLLRDPGRAATDLTGLPS